MPHALLVEDDPACLAVLERIVREHGFGVRAVEHAGDARRELERVAPELAVLDLDLLDGAAEELLETLASGFDTEVVVLSGEDSARPAVRALKQGVADYLTKPVDGARLERVLVGIKRQLDLAKRLGELRDTLRRLGRFERLVGASPAMQEVYDLVARVARTPTTVLVSGETGTGKELVAQCVHGLSRRADGPFVAVNCGAVQPTLIESELFGHESGSFTGASRARKGLFEQARGGTLFLDEVTEMPLDLQVKLLRVLEQRVVRRVGAEKSIPVDVRLIAATNRSPEEAVQAGALREDLFYRLQVFPIHVPPLRARGKDVELLALRFLEDLNERAGTDKKIEPEALATLERREWPGNVRELRNVVERAFVLAGDRIQARHLAPQGPSSSPGRSGSLTLEIGCSVAEAEKRLVLATLEHHDGDKKRAAAVLGISLKTLYNRLNTWGLGKRAKRTRG